MAWSYEITSGFLLTPTGLYLQPGGYAGNGDGKNNPKMQDVHDVGPLPCGWYAMETIVDAGGNPCDYHDAKGTTLKAPVIRLIPDPENQMFGRSGFLIHGDSVKESGTASNGCIVQSHANRVTLSISPDRKLQVIAQLPNNQEDVLDAVMHEK